MVTIKQIKETLYFFEPLKLPDDGSKRGAVLIPIYEKDSTLYILLTKRTNELPTHKGQISFPGGKIEETDTSLSDCALRETKEEIGISADLITIIGELNQSKTNHSNILISAFVSIIQYPFTLKINENEVKEIIEVPFQSFFNENSWEKKLIKIDNNNTEIWFFSFNGQKIWGATANLIRQLVDLLKKERH